MKRKLLVVLEPNQHELSRQDLRLISGAQQLAQFDTAAVDLLILGEAPDAVVAQAQMLANVENLLIAADCSAEVLQAESLAPWLAQLTQGYSALVLAATTWGKDLLPRLGALMDIQPITDIVEILSADCFKRPVYAGRALETLRSKQACKLLSLRVNSFAEFSARAGQASCTRLDPPARLGSTRILSRAKKAADKPDLGTASVVVSGGLGLQTSENFALIYQLAERLHGAVGASRAAVDAGFASNDQQVGQTGKIVAPDLYVAIGLSGAVQHQAGMLDSRVIVAINKDPDAPIFKVADYGLVGDLFDVLPKLLEAL